MYLFFLVTGFDTRWVPRKVSCEDRFTTFLSFEETRRTEKVSTVAILR